MSEYRRLTRRNEDGTTWVKCAVCDIQDKCDFTKECCCQELQDRLAEIEDKIQQGTLIELPCKVGDTVYKICPKCNSEHNGSCKNCAWRGCISYDGCSVFGLWGDGQYPPERCTIVPYTMDYRFIPVVLKHIGTKIFITREEAEARLKELQEKGNESIKFI